MEKSGKFVKDYPKVGNLTWKQKSRLIDLVNIPRASLSGIRMSPRKLRLVADAIRGKHVDEALGVLRFLPNAAAPLLHKLLKSAIANAGNVHELKADDLFVAKILINGGPTMKRFMARARGRACRIRKRTASALIVLREKVSMKKELAKTAPGKEVASKGKPQDAKPAEGGK
ncbi:MAG: 50S ribosomal protein L22 [Candidatus Riflebacteria bacterium]|nr:50S ribosomal protein L22 [Candidatus Riflebacteria bacterium]